MPSRYLQAAWAHLTGGGLRGDLLRGFLGVGSLRVLAKPLTLAVSILVARWLGPEGFGQYSFALAIVMILGLPVSNGLTNFVTREVAKSKKGDEWQIFRGLLRRMHHWVAMGSLVIGVLTIIVISIIWDEASSDRLVLILLGLSLLPVSGLATVYSASLRGLGHVVASTVSQVLRPTAQLAIITGAVLVGELVPEFALGARIGSGVIVLAVLFLVFWHYRPGPVWQGPATYRDRAWIAAWGPFTLLSATTLLNAQLGVLLLGWLGTDEQVAAMRVAERGAVLVMLPMQIANYVIGPQIARLHRAGDWRRLAKMARLVARTGLLIGLVPALICLLFAEPLVAIVLGEGYRGLVAGPLGVLAVTQLVNAGVGSVGLLLNMTGFERQSVIAKLIGLALNFLAGVSLIPAFGAVGAALAASLSIVTWNGLLAYRVYRQLGVRPGPV